MAAETLRVLESRPATAADLVEHLTVLFGIDTTEQLVGHVTTLLIELDDLGLIEPAPAC
jgi:hypothetical protein